MFPLENTTSEGHYPEKSINGRVAKKLLQFSDQLKQTAPTTDFTETARAESD